MSDLNRREILNLLALSFLPMRAPGQWLALPGQTVADAPNILILVFDAFSAENLSFFGYPRETTPNLNRLLERAVVYHNHYANGAFTTPGTASLLTGVAPWTHKAMRHYGKVSPVFQENNIFGLLDDAYAYKFVYTHNPLANILLTQFDQHIEEHISITEFMLASGWDIRFSPFDYELVHKFMSILLTGSNSSSADLFFANYVTELEKRSKTELRQTYKDQFPQGPPKVGLSNFTLETSIDWLIENADFPKPFMGYFHFYPPHNPYNPRKEFIDIYEDIEVPVKPSSIFGKDFSPETLYRYRKQYDQFIAYVDAEFYRLFDHLDKSGVLDNTVVILTSDHGEMFERGIWGQWEETLHQPVVHIPLVIFEPGRRERLDIYDNTSAVDVLPTLMHLAGKPVPGLVEGRVLPPFSPAPLGPDRDVFSVLAHYSTRLAPLEKVTVSLIKNDYKLMCYSGYSELPSGEPMFEMYDLKRDPQELTNLYDPNNPTFKDLNFILQRELEAKRALG